MGAQYPLGIPMASSGASPPLVAHLIDALDEARRDGGLFDLIRHLPPHRYRHAIVCLRGGACQCEPKVHGIDVVHLHRGAERDARPWLRLYRILRALRPDLVHSRDDAGLPAQFVAALAGVRQRVHAERGAAASADGANGARLPRRLLYPFVDHFIVASSGVEQWLIETMGAEPARVSQIACGVDSVQFHPRLGPAAAVGPSGFMQDGAFVVGSAGRMDAHSGHLALVEAFLRLIASPHPAHARLRLLVAGDGPVRAECQALLNRAGAAARAWLPGARPDLPQLLRAMDLFVLPAPIDDGSNVVLQAMASGLPVVAGGSGAGGELVHSGFTGILLPARTSELLASAIADYCRIPEMAMRHGARARSQVIAYHSMPAMARDYLAVYDALTRSADDAHLRRES